MVNKIANRQDILYAWKNYVAKYYPVFIASWLLLITTFFLWIYFLYNLVIVLDRRGWGAIITAGYNIVLVAILFIVPTFAREVQIPPCPNCGFKPIFGKPFNVFSFRKYIHKNLCPCCLYDLSTGRKHIPCDNEKIILSWQEYTNKYGANLAHLSTIFHISFWCAAIAFLAYPIWPSLYYYYMMYYLTPLTMIYITYSYRAYLYAKNNVIPCPCCHKLSPNAIKEVSFCLNEMIENRTCPICSTNVEIYDIEHIVRYWEKASGQ